MKKLMTEALKKYGHIVAQCAFAFAIVAANSGCALVYYEPEEPNGIKALKKITK